MIRAIIIDDEPLAINVLTKLLEKITSSIDIVAFATSAKDGYTKIIELQPDLVFLDVEMPRGNGFDLLAMFSEIKFQVIFTTAYEHYAIKAIKHSALDYILKPIDIEELKESVKKVLAVNNKSGSTRVTSLLRSLDDSPINKLILPNKGSYESIDLNDIILLKADNNYTEFIIKKGKSILVSKTIKEYEDLLSSDVFFRVHKSTIVNLNYIEKYTKGDGGEITMLNGSIVKVSRYRKKEFLKLFNG